MRDKAKTGQGIMITSRGRLYLKQGWGKGQAREDTMEGHSRRCVTEFFRGIEPIEQIEGSKER